jgi:hypothetical protein
MTPLADSADAHSQALSRLRSARQDFHRGVTKSPELRERFFAADHLSHTLRDRMARAFDGAHVDCCTRVLVLTTLLYGALDWHFAGLGIDIEADVQVERMRQNQMHGGPEADDALTGNDWRERLLKQVERLEQHSPPSPSYTTQLTKVAALAQAALEAFYRKGSRKMARQ